MIVVSNSSELNFVWFKNVMKFYNVSIKLVLMKIILKFDFNIVFRSF